MGPVGPPDTARLRAACDVSGLIMALGDRQDWHVRHDAAAALGEVGDPRAVEPLIACLRDPSEAVCDVAGWALGEIGDARAVEPLIAALRDSDGEVRGNVAGALGRIGDPRAVEPLIAALEGQSRFHRLAAALPLGEIGDPRAVEPLIAALADKDPLLRSAVATALGKLGDPRAVEPLVLALRDRGDDKGNGGAWVRQAAAQALMDMCRSGRLGPRDRALVVAQRSVITEEHHDRFGAYGDHEDEGIGVEFTL